MELKIRNVNKIKSADIQLNGLTVIVGENDSGKSTIGRVLFSAIKALVNTKASKIQKQEELLDKHVQSLYRRLSSTGYGGFSVATKRNVSPIPRNAYEFISELKKNNSIDEYIKGVSFFIENLEATPRMKSLMKEDLHLIGICMKEKDNRAANLFAEFRFLLESEFLNQFGSNNNVSINLLSDDKSKSYFSYSADKDAVESIETKKVTQFDRKEIFGNLDTDFDLESIREDWVSRLDSKQKSEQNRIADILNFIAHNEIQHAKIWYKTLNEGISDTLKNIKSAANGEKYEWDYMYKNFQKDAKEEGYNEIPGRLYGCLGIFYGSGRM